MDIHFKTIVPKTFVFRDAADSIWGQDVLLTQGSVNQIVASSGSGKSTLVAILSGLRGDYAGNLQIAKKNISTYQSKEWSEWRSQHASFVFQDLRLFPELSARDNISLSAELSNGYHYQDTDLVAMAQHLGIELKLNKFVKQLSYGQMQRVAIIRAICRNYQWLILDEPFSHLDMNNAQKAWSVILSDAKQKNAGIIITSLDPYPFINPDKVFNL